MQKKENIILSKIKQIAQENDISVIASKKDGVVGFQIRWIEDGKLSMRGYLITKHINDSTINNGDLFRGVYNKLVKQLFNFNYDAKSKRFCTKFWFGEIKQDHLKLQAKNNKKTVEYLINDKIIYSFNKKQLHNGKYFIPNKYVAKTYDVVANHLAKILLTSKDDFIKSNKLITLIIEYINLLK